MNSKLQPILPPTLHTTSVQYADYLMSYTLYVDAVQTRREKGRASRPAPAPRAAPVARQVKPPVVISPEVRAKVGNAYAQGIKFGELEFPSAELPGARKRWETLKNREKVRAQRPRTKRAKPKRDEKNTEVAAMEAYVEGLRNAGLWKTEQPTLTTLRSDGTEVELEFASRREAGNLRTSARTAVQIAADLKRENVQLKAYTQELAWKSTAAQIELTKAKTARERKLATTKLSKTVTSKVTVLPAEPREIRSEDGISVVGMTDPFVCVPTQETVEVLSGEVMGNERDFVMRAKALTSGQSRLVSPASTTRGRQSNR